jgi:hypothetical protein
MAASHFSIAHHDLIAPSRWPKKPYCSDDKTARNIRPFLSALKRSYIQANPPHLRVWLIFDVDREGAAFAWESWERPDLPHPNWVAINPANAFAHLVWGLSVPVLFDSPDMRQAPLRYLCAVEAAYRAVLGADQDYSGLLTKNPFHERWKVLWGPPGFYTLAELAECVDLPKFLPKRGRNPEQIGLGRNVCVFDDLRKWAYRHIRDYKAAGLPGWNPWMAECNARALGLNGDFPNPMDGREVWHIAKSVGKWTWRRFDIAASDARFSKLQAHRGRQGGLAKGVANEDKRASARLMRSVKGMTQAAIAAELGVTERTVRNWLHD